MRIAEFGRDNRVLVHEQLLLFLDAITNVDGFTMTVTELSSMITISSPFSDRILQHYSGLNEALTQIEGTPFFQTISIFNRKNRSSKGRFFVQL